MSTLLLAFLLAADPEPTAVGRAEEFVAALQKGDFDAATRNFDETMKKVMPADKLRDLWQKLDQQLGAIEKVLGTRTDTVGKYEIVFVSVQFAKAKMDIRVPIDAKKQIAGMQIVPPPAPYKAPDYVKPEMYEDTDVVVGKGTPWELPGTLSKPKGAAVPSPAVVLVHGSGPNDRDETVGGHKIFRDLAGGLASRGIAVLRYEKRTRAYGSKLKANEITIDTETVDDARTAIDLLRKTPGIDAKKLYVIGHSLGALMAPKIASLEPGLAGIVVMAGPTRPVEDLVVEQFEYLATLPGGDAIKEQLAKAKQQATRVKDPKLSPETPAAELPLGQPATYWLSFRGYDPAATAAKLSCKILILHGDRDYQVALTDFAGWEKALAGKPTATLKRFEDLNHLFVEGKGKATPSEYGKPGHVALPVIEMIAEWVKQ